MKKFSLLFLIVLFCSGNSFSQCASNATSTADEEILNVTFGTLNNSSTCATTGGTGSILNEYSNYAYAGFPGGVPNVDRGCTIPFSVQIGTCGGNYTNSIAIFIDWNNDLDFADAGEQVYTSPTATAGPHIETGNITVPATATLGNCRMRVVNVETSVPTSILACGTYTWGETEDYFINVTNGGGVAPYISSNVTQLVTGTVSQCAVYQQIICVQVVVGSGCTAGSISQFVLGGGSSTNLLADVTKIHIFYTGTNNTYLPLNEFVAGGTVPSGAVNTINGNQTLVPNDTNYFWIAYDMNPASVVGDLIDGSCTQFTYSGVNRIPTTTNPAGNGIIVPCPCSFTLGPDATICLPATYTINGPAGFDTYVWTPGGATTQNLTVNTTGTYSCVATLINGGLVSNGDFNAGNTGFTTSYTLGAGGAWGLLSNEGTYAVTTNPNLVHSNFYSFGDHTTGTGNMMVVNGSGVANALVWSQTITVLPNTNYNFSAWVASTENMSPGQEAQLQFSINGNLIGPITSAPFTGGVWANFFVNWNSGSSTTAVIRIVDQNVNTGANDFAIDDITFERICTYTDAINVTVGPNITPAFTAVAAICSGGTLSALPTTSTNGIVGTWSPALNNTATTTYTFTPNAGQCASTTTMTITVNPNITPTFTPVAQICSGDILSPLPTTSTNGITGTWSPALNNTATTTYTFTPTAGQCATTTTLTITVGPPATPTFTQVAAICSGAALPSLPTTSNNSFTGTWSPAVNNTATTTYTFTPTAGQCATTTTMTITVNPNTTPTFAPVGPYCSGATIPALPTTSINGITGTWSPAINNAATTTYTFTPTAGLCATTATLTITINPNITPTFAAVGPFCSGAAIPALPTTSTNGITGTWSPAINNAATTTYTFTPSAGQCATTTTMTITINPNITPAFASVGPFCAGDAIPALPTTSTNGITGSWSPAINNAVTTTYTFTPTAGQCATTTTLTITVNPNITPTFNTVGPFCAGASISPLPSTSINGITGTWSPAINNAATTVYTFTPAGGCAPVTTMSITINPNITPTFASVGPYCSGDLIPALPVTSTNGITGTWSPAINNTATTTYTFTPTAGLCATTTTLTITINPNITPTFAAVGPYCSGATIPALPTTSINGITGTWSPAINNTATTTYTFTPTAGLCATTTTLTITVDPNVTPTFAAVGPYCAGAAIPALPTTSTNGITGSWLPAIDNTTTTTYTFTPTAGLCATTTTITIVVNPNITPTFTQVAAICSGGSISALPTTSANGITGTWSPALNNTATTTYTFTPSAGQCATTATMTITVNPNPVVAASSNSPVCEGQSLNLNVIPSGLANYAWIGPNGFTGVIQNPSITNVTLLASGNYSVIAVDVNGCTGTSSTNVTINAIPTSLFSYTPISCTGSSIITYTGTGTSSGTFNWTWNGGVAVPGVGIGPHVVTWSSPGSKSISLIVTENGCSSSPYSVTLNYQEPLDAIITPVDLLCNGASNGSVNLVVTGGTPLYSFVWSNNLTTEDLTGLSEGLYTVTITDLMGCSIIRATTVNEPDPVLVSTIPSYSICNGEVAYLTASASGGIQPYSYYWNNTLSTASIGVQPNATTTYNVSVSDANGCASNLALVTVNVTLPLIVDVIATPSSICPGDTVQLTVNTSQGGGPPYIIYFADGTVITPPVFITPQTTGLQWIFVKDGCGSVGHDSVLITVNPTPVVNFVSDTVSGCEPLVVTFNPMNQMPGQTYYWNFQDGSYNQLSYDMNPVHEFSNDGIFDVSLTVTNSSGCSFTYVHNDMIQVYSNPQASFVADPLSVSIIKPEVHFNNYSTGANSYIWSFGDSDSSSTESPWHVYSAMGDYIAQLVAISEYGCTDTVTNNILVRDEYTFYAPNYFSPDFDLVNDVFFVVGNGISTIDFQMLIYDRWGGIIYKTEKYDPDQPDKYGWNGTYNNGEIVPVGTYTWLVKYYDGSRIAHVKSGPVNVIR